MSVESLFRRFKPGRRQGITSPDVAPVNENSMYNVFRYLSGDGSSGVDLNVSSQREFVTSGDHVYIQEINGSFPVYIRFNENRNPWIRLRRGMVLKRKFHRFWLRVIEVAAAVAGPSFSNLYSQTDVILYTSVGELILDRGEETAALQPGFPAYHSTFGPSPLNENVLLKLAPPGSRFRPTMFKNGGFVQLTNESLVSPIRIACQSSTNTGLILYPGSTWSVPVSGRLFGGDAGSGLFVWHDGAVVTYSVLFSSWELDLTDWRQGRSIGLV